MTRREIMAAAMAGLSATRMFARGGDGSELVGKPAPPLQLADWINSSPLEMAALRGKVVFLRWWTAGCPYCAATAPSLNALSSQFAGEGLQVLGVYHPKPPGHGNIAEVRSAVEEKKFTFPVAIDWNWTALKRWWLFEDREFTSASFLVDRDGLIRYVHPGGEFHEGDRGGMPSHAACRRDYAVIRTRIQALLKS